MEKPLSFNTFVKLLEEHALSRKSLEEYVEFDPMSSVPKLKFRSTAWSDAPDPHYDVDRAIYDYSRRLRDSRRVDRGTQLSNVVKSIVAEGDSWFQLPFVQLAIADWFEEDDELKSRFDMRNEADWGHTLAQIRQDRRHIKEMKKNTPDFFMFSAGGNDLQKGLADEKFLYGYDPDRDYDRYLTDKGLAAIATIGQGYCDIFDEVTAEFPSVKSLCHGYDYPRPHVDGYPSYVKKYLEILEIPDECMDAVLKPIIDLLNNTIVDAIKKYGPSVEFINLRNKSGDSSWWNDMHPGTMGFKKLALEFEKAMLNGSTISGMFDVASE